MINTKISRKGVSPVIATVLLITMVIVISLIIFLWFNNLNEEAVTKFGGKNIKIVCDDVQFQLEYNAGSLSIFNSGNVPIYNFKVKIEYPGGYQTKNLNDPTTVTNWPERGLGQGKTFLDSNSNIIAGITSVENLIFIPELIGSSNNGNKLYLCEERYGYKITI